MVKKSQKHRSTDAVLEVLEQRVLYSAEGLFDLPILYEKQSNDSIAESFNSATATSTSQQRQPAPETPASIETFSEEPTTEELKSPRTEIVFVDLATPHAARFAQDIQSHASDSQLHFVTIDSGQNGLDLISETLAKHSSVAAVHIISHGDDGQVQLGTQLLNTAALDSHGAAIKAWRTALSSDADILIYGCDVAATSTGQQFVAALAQLTDADVAASNNLTGHESLGGDWTLEHVHGAVETPLALSKALQNDWQGTLDISSNLVAHYQFEDASGTIATDSVGNADATLSNGAAFTTQGKLNNALIVSADSGGDSIATIPNAAQFDFGSDDFTIAFWFNTDTLDSQIMFHHDDNANGHFISTTPAGQLVWSIDGSLNTTNIVQSGLAADTWYHVTAKRTGDTFTLTTWDGATYYSQGVTQAMGSLSTTADIKIGAFNSVEFDGRIDDLRLYKGRALSNGDVVELHNYTPPDNPPTDLSSGIELNTDGGNDAFFAAISAEPVFGDATQRTVEFNLQFDDSSGSNPHLLSFWTSSQPEEFEIALSSANEVTLTIGGTTYTGVAHPELRDGGIHQIAASWDNTTGAVAIYVDGQFSSSGNLAAGYVLGSAGALDIGQGQTPSGKLPSEVFAGTFYDIRVWDSVRTASDIASNYQRKFNPSSLPATLVANFQFDGFDASNIIADETSVSNGLTIQHVSAAGFTSSTPVEDLNIDENPLNGTRIGFVVPTDPDAQANFTFNLTNNPAGRFAVDSDTGEVTVANGAQFDHETGPTNALEVGVTDATGNTYLETMPVAVNDINESPTINNSGGTVTEAQYVTVTPAMLEATDVDDTDTAGNLTYTASNLLNGQIEISGAPSTPITTFTQAQINAGQIVFLHDGSETTTAGFDYSLADGLEDGVTPVTGTFSLSVANVNDAPIFSNLDDNPTFVEDAAAVVLDADVTLFDADLSAIDNFSNATLYVGRSGGANSDDNFSATGLLGPLVESSSLTYNSSVVGTVNVSSGGELVLQFNSSATNSIVNGVLQSIAYSNSSNTPPASVDLHLTFNDNNSGSQGTGGAKWDSDTLLVSITETNDAPVIDLDADNSSGAGLSFETTFTEGAGPVLITDSDALLTDADDTDLTGLVAFIVNQPDGTDEWLWANTGVSGISQSYNSGTGTLTLSGSAPVADYQQVLRTLSYENHSDNPDTTQRTINVAATDSTGGSLVAQARVNITVANDAPLIDLDTDNSTADGIAYTGTFMQGYGPVAIADTDLTIVDPDHTTLASLSITITNLLDGTDESLTVTLPNSNWVSFYNDSTGELLIVPGIGSTLAEWEAVIASVRYDNASVTPITTTRVIEVSGSDGVATNFPIAQSQIAITANQSPIIGTSSAFAVELTEDNGPVGADVGLSVADADSPTLASATVSITANYQPFEDTLSFTNQSGITASWNAASGMLTLTGSASVADYQTALRSVQIANSAQSPNTDPRVVSWSVSDGITNSNTLTRQVNINAVNDAPVFSVLPGHSGQIVDSGITGANSTSVADIDGDGNPDLVTTSSTTGSITYYPGDGSGNFGSGTLITNTLDEPQEVSVADLDGDGDADLIAADYSTSQDNLLLYSNDGAGNFTETILDTSTSGVVQVDTGDLDGDGDIDIAAHFWFSGEVVWYENLGGGSFVRNVIDSGAGGTSIEISDINQDGEADIIASFRNSNSVVYYQNDGGANGFTASSYTVSQAFDVAPGDFNNDGDIDLGYIGLTGAVGWLESSGGSNPVFTDHSISNVGRGVQIFASDVDNDGDSDLLATRDSAGEFVLFDNDGTGQFSQSTFATANSAREIVAADLDNDGDADIITSSASNADVQVFTNQGSGEYSNYITNEDTSVTLDPIVFIDADAGASQLQATIDVANGTMNLSNTSGLNFTTGDGSDNSSLIFVGTMTDINAALSAIEFQPDINFSGAATVDITINDQGNSGSGGPLTTMTRLIIDVNPVNDSPVINNNTGALISVGDTLTLTPAMLLEGDPDDNGADLTYTVVSAPVEGYLALNSAPATPVSVFTQADINSGNLIYVHNGTTTSNDSFDLSLADDGADGSVAASATFTITLTGALADSYTTDEDTALSIPAVTGVLANDAQGVPQANEGVATFYASADNDGNNIWSNNTGTGDLSLGTGVTHTIYPPSPPVGITAAFELNGSGGITGPALHGFSGIDAQASATVETWMYFENLNGHQIIFDTGNTTDTGITLVASGNGIDLAVAKSGQLTSNFKGSLLTPDTWHHIVMTIDMDAGTPVVSIWVDGSREVQVSRSLNNWAPGPFGLGTVNGTTVGGYSGNLEGYIASFVIHDEVLDSATINSYYTSPGSGTSTPFVVTTDTSTTNGAVSINPDGSFTYNPDGKFETLASSQSATDTFSYTYDDGSGNTDVETVTITINGVNDSPVLGNLSGDTLTFTEDDPATIIDQSNDAFISDIDNTDINGAVLTVAITTGADPTDDIVSIRHDGDNVNQIGYNAGILKYSGTVIGTVSGGTNAMPLTITFNANATTLSASATLRNITYHNTDGESPSTASRTVEFKFSDPEFAVTTVHLATVNVDINNDLPTTDSTMSTRNEDRNKILISVRGDDIDGSVDFIRVTSLPANGSLFADAALGNAVSINTDYPTTAESRFFYFVPDTDWNGTTSFTYAALDNDGGLDNTDATGTFVVHEVNDAPTRTAGAVVNLTVAENSDLAGLGLESLAYNPGGGSDESTQTLTISVTGVPSGIGTIVLADGTTSVATNSTYSLQQLRGMQFKANPNTVGGPEIFSFSITDNGTTDGVSDPVSLNETLAITVYPVNDDPVVTGNNFNINEGDSITLTPFHLTATDTDTPATDLLFSVSNVANGQFEAANAPGVEIQSFTQSQLTSGQIGYIHDGGEQAPSFDITVSDTDGGSTTVAANVSFSNINDDPYNAGTIPDRLIALEDTPTTVDTSTISIADVDAGSGDLTLTISTSAGTLQALSTAGLTISGSLTGNLILTGTVTSINDWLNTTAALTYTGSANTHGNAVDDINFSLVDNGNTGIGGGTTISLGSINVDITGVNDAPIGTDNTVTTAEDSAFTFAPADFGFSDVLDGNVLQSVIISTLPSNGQLLLNNSPVLQGSAVPVTDIATSQLVFEPTADEYGTRYSAFWFRVQDAGGTDNNGSNTDTTSRTIAIDVTAVNDAPFGSDELIRTSEDTDITLTREDFGFVDNRDPADQLSAVQIDSLPVYGQLLLNNAEVDIGDLVSAYSIDSGQLVYHPDPDDNGEVSFEFRVIDDNLQPGIPISQTDNLLTIAIDPVSDAPSGSDGTRSIVEDSRYSFSVADFGFSDALDNDSMTGVHIDLLPANGTLTLSGNVVAAGALVTTADIASGQFQYQPSADTHGNNVDQIGFRVVDNGEYGPLNTDPIVRTLYFNVLSVNDAPGSENSTISTAEDTDYVFSRADFKFTDDADGDAFSYLTITSLPETGTLFMQGIPVEPGDTVNVASLDAGELVYQPTLNANGSAPDGFTFTVTDDGGVALGGEDTASDENTISIDVAGMNDSPVLIANGATLDEGGSIIIDNTMLGGTDADDPTPDELLLTVTTLPAHGQLLLNGEALTAGSSFTLRAIETGALSYRHDASETSTDSFDVTLTDGGEDGALPAQGRFDLTVNEVIDAAVELGPDSLHLTHGQSFDSTAGDKLLSGYSSLDSGSLLNNTVFLVEIEAAPTQGTVELHADGTFTYVHNGSDVLHDEFSYRVTNEDGIFTVATVTVTIDPPIAQALEEIPPPEETAVNYVEHLTNEPEETVVESTGVIEGSPQPTTENQTFVDLDSGDSSLRFLATDADENRRTATLGEVEIRHPQQAQASDPGFATHQKLGVKQHREQGVVSIDNELQLVSTATFDLILELKVATPKQVASNPGFLQGLAQLDNDFAEMDKQQGQRYTLAEETVLGMSFSITVGMLAWAMRGGALVASIMAFAPIWSVMDFGRLISSAEQKKKEREMNAPNEDDVRIESLFEKED